MKPSSSPPRPAGPPAEEVVYTLSPSETHEIGRRLGTRLIGGEMVLLVGELGMGKTVFVKGLAAGLGIDPEEVNSPTFVLVSPHEGRVPLYHIDLYRLDRAEEAFDLGIDEFLESGGIVAVEWGEKLPAELKEGALEVRFTDLGQDSRRLVIRPGISPGPAPGRGPSRSSARGRTPAERTRRKSLPRAG